jgi:hypothetical protein
MVTSSCSAALSPCDDLPGRLARSYPLGTPHTIIYTAFLTVILIVILLDKTILKKPPDPSCKMAEAAPCGVSLVC